MNTQEDKLWVAMLKRKYLKNHTLANWPSSRSVSHTWRSIKKTNVITQMGTKWVIGNGNDIDLWNDQWCGDKPLGLKFFGTHTSSNQKVSDIIDSNGAWNLFVIPSLLDVETVNTIHNIHLTNFSNATDRPTWFGSQDGKFSVSAAYEVINKEIIYKDGIGFGN